MHRNAQVYWRKGIDGEMEWDYLALRLNREASELCGSI
jgi:hypothetical protein